MKNLSRRQVSQLLERARSTRILVLGDLMLDQFLWGNVRRISPEAPVPVVEFNRESFMPGGAANVARNLTSLQGTAEMFGVVGRDEFATQLKKLLKAQNVGCAGIVGIAGKPTSIKTRIIAHQQQLVRVDREDVRPLDRKTIRRLLTLVEEGLAGADALIIGDYGKGVVSQELLDELRVLCRTRGVWLSLDPKPVHHLNLKGLSLITPNRKEAFELAGVEDHSRGPEPLQDKALMSVAEKLLEELQPALLLVTLGEQGMLLCRRGTAPFHIPTVAQEVFDVSGAGDTVIASFTLAIAAGASPIEAAIFSNHAAGVVVGKVGTACVSPEELLASFS
ncbi:MAG: D-glycero-beta-D-manno-heptose-7-phosphate kinase [Verrucomicrobiota bacterium]|nr:D-glycero-beta-D-manno-heptose-7-phosphate kinase [Verrucomicrobiota bacterium]